MNDNDPAPQRRLLLLLGGHVSCCVVHGRLAVNVHRIRVHGGGGGGLSLFLRLEDLRSCGLLLLLTEDHDLVFALEVLAVARFWGSAG